MTINGKEKVVENILCDDLLLTLLTILCNTSSTIPLRDVALKSCDDIVGQPKPCCCLGWPRRASFRQGAPAAMVCDDLPNCRAWLAMSEKGEVC